jgi:hypothetical protein
MQVTSKLRLQLLVQNGIFVVLLIALVALLAFFAQEYRVERDLTQNARNTVSQQTREALGKLTGPIKVTTFATRQDVRGDLRKQVQDFFAPYQRIKSDLSVSFVDPREEPKLAQAAGIRINGVANFGGPVQGNADSGFGFTEGIFQILDNLSYIRGNHAYKFGFNTQAVSDSRTQTLVQLYTFANVDAFLAARSGTNPFGYTSFQQFVGNPTYEYDTRMYGGFVQDDWRLTPTLKLLYGVRYDTYTPPEGIGAAVLDASREFPTDKNNVQPRVGFVWALGEDRRTVLRGNSGLMYDQPINAIYEQAIVNDGTPARASFSLQATQAGAPPFPNVLSSGNAAANNPWIVNPDFRIARMWQNNVQLERGIWQHYSASVGASYTRGYNLPVVSNINLLAPIGALPDGRPIYPTAISPATRVDPRFNAVFSSQAVGESRYRAMTLQFTRRLYRGVQWDLAYTLARSEDTAPITSTLSVQGDTGGRSDPASLETDKGPNILDQRHTFVGSIVAQPEVDAEGIAGAILSNNLFGIALQFASGIPVTLRSSRELNNDAIGADRPIGVTRNSYNLPARYNVDLRYSRLFPVAGRVKVELMAEVKNLFNTEQWASATTTVNTDALGNPVTAAGLPLVLPAPGAIGRDAVFSPTGGYEQRQFQLGFKFTF